MQEGRALVEQIARRTLEKTSRIRWQELLQQGPQAVAEHENRRCPHCHVLLVPEIQQLKAPWLDEGVILHAQWPVCGCAGAQAEHERHVLTDQEREKRERAQRLAAAYAAAGLTGHLASCSFDAFERRDDWPVAAERCKKARLFVDAVLNGTVGDRPWLVMHGRYGTGKTHLAAAIIREAIDAGMRSCYFRPWTLYLERLKASWGSNPTERTVDIVAEVQRGRLVVIDDIDKARDPSGWARETLYTILDYRYNARLPTVLTFNYDPGEIDPDAPGLLMLERFMTRAVIDRVLGAKWEALDFNGPSYRSEVTWNVRPPVEVRR